MPVPPPPPKQLALLLVIDRFRLRVPQWVGLVALAVALPAGLWMGLGDSRGSAPLGPVPAPVPQVALQTSTFAAFPAMVLSRLPDGVDLQRKPPCDPDAEEAIGGWCWIPLRVEKCPVEQGKAFEHEKKCYLRSMRAARAPTTGDPHTAPVAGQD